MRKVIDTELLTFIVNLVIPTLSSFSSYDVTSIIRSQLPNYEVDHNTVRDIVRQFVSKNFSKYNSISTTDGKNVYLVYKLISSFPANIGYGTSTSQVAKQTTKTTRLQNLLRLKNLKTETLHVQSEKRLNITNIVRKYFPKEISVTITKYPNKIVVSNYNGNGSYSTRSEIRIRTGFDSNLVKAEFDDQTKVLTLTEVKV